MARKLQLHGSFPSKAGDSAYQVAQKAGFEGTEQEWLSSLVGPQGPQGQAGKDAEPTSWLYPSINDAVIDLNNGVTDNSTETGPVRLSINSAGTATITLLESISETQEILLTKNCDFQLGGHTLTFASDDASISLDSTVHSCVIDATGSTIVKNVGSGRLVTSYADNLEIRGGNYSVETQANHCAFDIEAGQAVIKNATVTCANTATGRTRAAQIKADASLRVEDCTISATAEINYTFLVAGELDILRSKVTGTSTATTKVADSQTIRAQNTATVYIEDSEIYTVGSSDEPTGIRSVGKLDIVNSKVILNSPTKSTGVLFSGYNFSMVDSSIEVTTTSSDTYTIGVHCLYGESNISNSSIKTTSANAAIGIYCVKEAIINATKTTVMAESNGVSDGATNIWAEGVECYGKIRLYDSHVSSVAPTRPIGFWCTSDGELEATGTTFNAEGTESEIIEGISTSRAIDSSGPIYLTACRCAADAPHERAVGVLCRSNTVLVDTDCSGTHSGINSLGDMYIHGGKFTGWAHGGVYCANGSDDDNAVTRVYINDAYLQCGYSGKYSLELREKLLQFWSCMYVGDSNHNRVFMDGVEFGTIDANFDIIDYNHTATPYQITLRGSANEVDNIVYISNTKIPPESGCIRIDKSPDDGHDLGHRMYIGTGCNIESDVILNPDLVTYCDGTFRRSRAFFETGEVREATVVESSGVDLSGYLKSPATAEVGQTIAVKSVDETGQPVEWEAVDMPTGGETGGIAPTGFKLISLLETTEEVDSIDISVADDGETVADKQLTEAMLQLFCPRNENYPASGVAVNVTLWYPYDAFGVYTISPAMGQTQVWTALYLKACGIPVGYHFHQDGDFKGAGGSNLIYTSVGNAEAESREPYFYHKGFRLRAVDNVFPIGTKVRIFGR